MRYATQAMKDLLASGRPLLLANLYTLTLRDGSLCRWTSADTDLTVGQTTWTCPDASGSTCPILKRGAIRNSRGLEVQTTDLTLLCGDALFLSGVHVQRFALNGGFDGTHVRIDLAVMPAWGDTSAGALCLFEGQVAGVDPSSTAVVLHLKSELEKLELPMPRRRWQPQCNSTLGDAGCGLSLASLTASGTLAAGCTPTHIYGASGSPDGHWTNGVLTLTSGRLAGSRRAVQAYTGGVITLAIPLLEAPGKGDTFTLSPGCDRQRSTCCDRYHNGSRFSGCPVIPVPETVR